jgi:hypothetical protein
VERLARLRRDLEIAAQDRVRPVVEAMLRERYRAIVPLLDELQARVKEAKKLRDHVAGEFDIHQGVPFPKTNLLGAIMPLARELDHLVPAFVREIES